jgi:hypothetical protein
MVKTAPQDGSFHDKAALLRPSNLANQGAGMCHEGTLSSSMFEQEIARSNAGLISSGVRFRIRVLWGAFRYFLYVEIIE